MPAGLQVWDEQGYPVVSVTDRLSRVLGTFSTGTSSGTVNITVPGIIWFLVHVPTSAGAGSILPQVQISGRSITWSFATVSGLAPSGVSITYGVY